MSSGVEVQINTKDPYEIKGKGYILRRINAELYEVWSEQEQTVLLLSPKEFNEVDLNI